MDEAQKHLDSAKGAAQQAARQADGAMRTLTSGLGATIAATQLLLEDVYSGALHQLDRLQVYVDGAKATAVAVEDAAVQSAKGLVAYTVANPTVSYPALTTAVLLALPGVRSGLYRATIGQFIKTETVLNNAAARVDLLRQHSIDYAMQLEKLEQRLAAAEEQYLQGQKQLKATRQELQRLGSGVLKDQAAAQGVVSTLRAYKKLDASLPVRGAAADHAAAFKAMLGRINKGVLRVANRDI